MTTSPSSTMTRAVVDRWFGALRTGDSVAALACLADDVLWINSTSDRGLSDIIPWLGEYRGRAAVAETFVIWAQLSQVRSFELRELVIDGDEAFAVVHEIALIKPSGQTYDIEFIQRMRVADDRIVFWKSYWDTLKGIAAFRGDMSARLVAAAKVGDLDEANRLLPYGADPNAVEPETHQTLLMLAAARGHTGFVRALLQAGADPNATDRRAGTTALHKACQAARLDVVELLVEAGASINQQAFTTGHTPLVEAIWYKADDIAAFLVARGALLGLPTYYGFTIDQHIAYAKMVNSGTAALARLQRIEQLVAERRADDDQHRGSRLLGAAKLGFLAEVQVALANGCDLEERWPMVGSLDDGHTALLIAARENQIEVVKALIAGGADVNAVEPVFGAVPLHKATYHGWVEITRLLAAAPGINLNYQGPSNGYTPLHDALWHGKADCADILLDAGARTDVVAYDGKRPIDIAREELGVGHPIVGRLG